MDQWRARARWMIGRAVPAPSSHDTQPWIFRTSASAIDLFADRTRALPANDPDDRELVIRCGCAFMNLRVAASSVGFGVKARLLPEREDPDLRARVSPSEQSSASPDDAQLAEGSPLVAVLTTDGDHPRDGMLAGQGLRRLLLVACKLGLQASYLNQPVQVASLRPELRNRMGAGFPRILLRLGCPLEEISPAPRRALDDVIE